MNPCQDATISAHGGQPDTGEVRKPQHGGQAATQVNTCKDAVGRLGTPVGSASRQLWVSVGSSLGQRSVGQRWFSQRWVSGGCCLSQDRRWTYRLRHLVSIDQSPVARLVTVHLSRQRLWDGSLVTAEIIWHLCAVNGFWCSEQFYGKKYSQTLSPSGRLKDQKLWRHTFPGESSRRMR